MFLPIIQLYVHEPLPSRVFPKELVRVSSRYLIRHCRYHHIEIVFRLISLYQFTHWNSQLLACFIQPILITCSKYTTTIHSGEFSIIERAMVITVLITEFLKMERMMVWTEARIEYVAQATTEVVRKYNFAFALVLKIDRMMVWTEPPLEDVTHTSAEVVCKYNFTLTLA